MARLSRVTSRPGPVRDLPAGVASADRGGAPPRTDPPPGARPTRYEPTGEWVPARTGLVRLPLPEGVALSTRDRFIADRATAARLAAGHPGLTTVAVSTRDGGFLLGDHAGGESVYSGHRLGEALDDLPAWGGDIRVWLSWPAEPALQRRLQLNLTELADTVGATVWSPSIGGSAKVIDACADLGALDRDSRPARWQHHPPSGPPRPPRFESDTDGRLVPVGGPLASGRPGVPLISVAPSRRAAMAERYARLDFPPGLFAADLAVLDDGRLAAVRADGTLLALGPRECRLLLAAAGWWDEDLVLLCPGEPAELPRHVHALFAGLGVDVWALPPGATVESPDGRPRAMDADHRPVPWRRLVPSDPRQRPPRWHSQDGELVPARSDGPTDRPRPAIDVNLPDRPDRDPARPDRDPARPDRGPVRPDRGPTVGPMRHDPPHGGRSNRHPGPAAGDGSANHAGRRGTAAGQADPGESRADLGHPCEPAVTGPRAPLPELARPTFATERRAGRHGPGLGVPWLPQRLRVNTEPCELYLHTHVPPPEAVEDGIPSPDLFLVGELDPPVPGSDAPGGYLLRVRVEPGAAVDITDVELHVPPTVYLSFAGREVYLLPAGRLDRLSLRAGYALAPSGEPARVAEFAGEPVRLRCAGARHGVPGLPNDVPRWPVDGPTKAYALLPVAGRPSTAGVRPADGGPPSTGGVRLYRKPPRVDDEHRLLELRVERRQAIDVREAAGTLTPLRAVRSSAAGLSAAGVGLILPSHAYDRVAVTRVLAAHGRRWRPTGGDRPRPLSALLDAAA